MKMRMILTPVSVIFFLTTGCKKEPKTITETVTVTDTVINTVTNTVYGSLEQGLLLSYDFSSSLLDGSSNANDINVGASAGYAFAADRYSHLNKAVSFSGAGQLVLPSNNTYKVQFPFTVSFWTNIADSSSINNRFFWSDGSSSYNGFFIQSNPSGDGTGTSSGSRRSAYSSVSLRSNNWQHILVIYKSSSETEIYIDGVKDNGVTYDGSASAIAFTSLPGEIGHLPGNSYYLNGKMDKVHMWNRALNLQEISQEYNSTF